MAALRAHRVGVAAAVVVALLSVLIAPPLSAAPAAVARLANTGHLDFLSTMVTPPDQARHTTYRLASEPAIGQVWTYADRREDGSFERVGGGEYDPSTNTWGQGAFNADDTSRAAVAYIRHWRSTGSADSRRHAYEMLRGLAYLQTTSGPNRGNVVLWMQPDGTLTPSAEPVELPDPSDSGPSYWLARTIWAYGEGYAAFKGVDAGFASFLRDRMQLSLGAVERQVLSKYGRYLTIDGQRRPAWLIVDGADASAEAVFGLAAYVSATGEPRARRALSRLAEGIAILQGGSATDWPLGAVMPWVLSRSLWHGWGSQMSGSLIKAGSVLRQPPIRAAGLREVGVFTPHLLIQGGPDNGWLPAPSDRVQIAYGADSTLRNLLTAAEATGSRGYAALAAVAGSWYFGNNKARAQVYDPATGVTVDGVEDSGTINQNSGAESTIHALLSMIALDQHPAVAAQARAAGVLSRRTWTLSEAEAGAVRGGASIVTPTSSWTGEGGFSGGQYVALPPGSSVTVPVTVPASDRYVVYSVVDRQPRSAGPLPVAVSLVRGRPVTVETGLAGAQGASEAPGFLDYATTSHGWTAAGESTAAVRRTDRGSGAARLDALLLQPEVEWVSLSQGAARPLAILRTVGDVARRVAVPLAGFDAATVSVYASDGSLTTKYRTGAGRASVDALVRPGGFTVVQR